MRIIDNIPVWGDPLDNAVEQMINCSKTAERCALMADHHLGYSQPIGGVVAYKDKISPSGVGYDIACGNKAVRLDCDPVDVKKNIETIMDDIVNHVSFGVGRVNKEEVDHGLFDDDAWRLVEAWNPDLKDMARRQLGTVGSGNHYVDIFIDELNRVWVGVHFGSRGLGHKIATHYVTEGGGKDGINEPPTLLDEDGLGEDYLRCMNLAGRYAYAGRDWVCQKVASIIGSVIEDEIHNHHNFAWYETHSDIDLWVVRKGATPAFPGQRGFVGGSMGENSVIIEGVDSPESKLALYSTVHGAGRVMGRREAAGKRRWKKGKQVQLSEGKISQKMMDEWVNRAGVCLRGGGRDESPHCYKRLPDVLESHKNTINILHTLKPIGVAMAGCDTVDPYKD